MDKTLAVPDEAHAAAKQQLVKQMFQKSVLQVHPGEGFVLTSGKVAPIYLDHRVLFGEPKLRLAALELWVGVIRRHCHKRGIDPSQLVFAGTATAGIAPAFGLADRLGASFVYVRSAAKKHGLARQFEGHLPAGAPVAVIDDMVSTGGSLKQAAADLLQAGHQVVMTSSFTSRRSGANSLSELTPFFSVFWLQELLETAKQLDLITAEQWERCEAWLGREG